MKVHVDWYLALVAVVCVIALKLPSLSLTAHVMDGVIALCLVVLA